MLAATLDTLIEQIGGALIALIGAVAAVKGIQLSVERQKEPTMVKLDSTAMRQKIVELTDENHLLRAQRDAYHAIMIAGGLDRRHPDDLAD